MHRYTINPIAGNNQLQIKIELHDDALFTNTRMSKAQVKNLLATPGAVQTSIYYKGYKISGLSQQELQLVNKALCQRFMQTRANASPEKTDYKVQNGRIIGYHTPPANDEIYNIRLLTKEYVKASLRHVKEEVPVDYQLLDRLAEQARIDEEMASQPVIYDEPDETTPLLATATATEPKSSVQEGVYSEEEPSNRGGGGEGVGVVASKVLMVLLGLSGVGLIIGGAMSPILVGLPFLTLGIATVAICSGALFYLKHMSSSKPCIK